ncbi:MAG TPA: class I SAM-dependent methyltransferase [Candidatus Krumholzibacteria bacterium]|nr:class I SAM-dependent methyltransferase [Candidatus Krumholzibacteria bacterium]
MATRTQPARSPRGPRFRDRHWLYQESVQSPEVHFTFFDRVYRLHNGRLPRVLKEDFCGTALMAREWVELREDNIAIGVDLDAPTLRWGREHNLNKLEPDERERVILFRDNVLHVTRPKVDVIAALNFSYNIFHSREALCEYFRAARRSLAPGGLFIGDIFGGWEAQKPMQERTRHSGFTYVWDQASFDPVRNNGVYHIHFEFHNGGGIRRAFTYDWRLWSMPEIRELLEEAGFSKIEFYWEDIDRRTGFGNSRFRRITKAKNSEGWIAYFVASVSSKKRA